MSRRYQVSLNEGVKWEIGSPPPAEENPSGEAPSQEPFRPWLYTGIVQRLVEYADSLTRRNLALTHPEIAHEVTRYQNQRGLSISLRSYEYSHGSAIDRTFEYYQMILGTAKRFHRMNLHTNDLITVKRVAEVLIEQKEWLRDVSLSTKYCADLTKLMTELQSFPRLESLEVLAHNGVSSEYRPYLKAIFEIPNLRTLRITNEPPESVTNRPLLKKGHPSIKSLTLIPYDITGMKIEFATLNLLQALPLLEVFNFFAAVLRTPDEIREFFTCLDMCCKKLKYLKFALANVYAPMVGHLAVSAMEIHLFNSHLGYLVHGCPQLVKLTLDITPFEIEPTYELILRTLTNTSVRHLTIKGGNRNAMTELANKMIELNEHLIATRNAGIAGVRYLDKAIIRLNIRNDISADDIEIILYNEEPAAQEPVAQE